MGMLVYKAKALLNPKLIPRNLIIMYSACLSKNSVLSLRFGVEHWYLATKRAKYYNLKEEHYRMKFWCISHVVNNNSAKCRISEKFASLLCERHTDPFKFMLTESWLHTLCKQSFILSQRWRKTFYRFCSRHHTDSSSCRLAEIKAYHTYMSGYVFAFLIASAVIAFIKNQNHPLKTIRSPEKKN